LILRVFVSDIIIKKDKYGPDYYWIVGVLQSGMDVIIEDIYFNLQECVGHQVEMLLSFMRSPYFEQQMGIHSQPFLTEKFYSVELVNEILGRDRNISSDNRRIVILKGEIIDSYIIPEKWIPLVQRESFKALFKEPSALGTEDGDFILYPYHSRKKFPVPQEVIMAGVLRLEAFLSSF
jgi:hypothetical protein